MKRVAGHLIRTLIGVLVVLLVSVAVLVGLARQLVTDIHEMQPQVAEYLSQRTGWVISFDDLQGSWKGLAPRIQLQNVQVRQRAELPPAVLLRGLDLEVLLLPSLWNLEPRMRITLDGALLTLAQKDSRMVIEGLESPRKPDDKGMAADRIADLITSQPRAEINDSRVVVLGWYEQPVILHLQRLKIESDGSLRYMAGDVTLQGPSQLGFQLRGQLRGSLLQSDGLTGDLYLDTAQANWLPWIPEARRHFRQVELDSLLAGAETWLHFNKGALDDASVRFVVHEFNLHSDNEVQPPLVKQMSGLARWQRESEGGWRAGIEEFRMVTPRFNWQPSVLGLAAMPQPDGGTRYGLSLDDADITPWLHYFLSTQAEEGKLYDTLNALRPEGKLRRLSLFMLHKDNFLQDIRLAARLEQFNSHPWEKFPGVRDLDLDIWAHNDVYVARLDDSHLELDYPHLFRETLVLRHVAGTVALTRQEDSFLLQSGPIHLNTDDARSATQFSLSLPFDKTLPPFLSLQSTLRDVDGAVKSRYLPAGVIPPRLLSWLDDSILAGKLLRGDIVVHGNLGREQIPNRRVLLGFSVHDGELRFLPDWQEPVRNADADVIIDRGSVRAVVTRGEYFGLTLEQGAVDARRVAPEAQSMLNVKVQAHGPADRGFNILQDTPLAKMTGDIVQEMSLAGDMTAAMDLTVPLEKGEQQIAADVDVTLEQGRFRLESRDLQVNELNAQVHFSLANGLSAQRLQGKALGGEISGTIDTTPLQQGGKITALKLSGTAAVPALKDWLKLAVLAPLSGTAPYQLHMELPTGEAREHKHAYLNITSNLEGTAVDLPFPFGKTARGRSHFRVWQSLGRDPALLGVRYGDLFELSTQSSEGELQKGTLTLGGEKAALPNADRFVVQGTLPRLVISEWLPVLENLKSASDRYSENIQPSRLRMLGQSRLTVDEFVLGERNLGRQQLALQPQADGWALTLDGDFLQGSALLPAHLLENPGALLKNASGLSQQPPLVVNLSRVKLPESPKTEDSETPPWQPTEFSPLSLPAADITISQLLLGDADFGRWAMKLRPRDQGVALQDVSASMRGLDLSGEGFWRDVNGERSTTLKANYKADDVANVMRGWGSVPTMGSKDMKGNLDLQWQGAPFEFSVARARGDIDLRLKDGSFYNVQSGVAGKFWGALNFETVLRRLQLNFKDLQEEDMVYDEITARAHINNGIMKLANLKLDSPSIRLQTGGDIDLNASQLDLVMNVTVPVTRNLVLPAAVVGGVPAAAAVWAVEKVLGSQFDKLTTIKYSVKGNFDAPKVTVMESFNIIPDRVSETVISGEKKQPPTQPAEQTLP